MKGRSLMRKLWLEWRGVLLFVCFLVPLKSSFADWNWVPTGSMNPTIVEGDLVFINKLAYDLRVPLSSKRLHRFKNPERGEIAVLISPDDGIRLVKRVVGTPGDRIELRDNVLFVNDEALEYSNLSFEKSEDVFPELRKRSVFGTEVLGGREHAVMRTPQLPSRHRNFGPVTVPDNKYFVMGDNRDNSRDSRAIGFADRDAFLGEATTVLMSFNIQDKYQPRFGRFFTSLD